MLNKSISRREVAIERQKNMFALFLNRGNIISFNGEKFKIGKILTSGGVISGYLLINKQNGRVLNIDFNEFQDGVEKGNIRILDIFKELLRTSEAIHLIIDGIIMDTFTKKPCPFSNPPLTEAQKKRFYS